MRSPTRTPSRPAYDWLGQDDAFRRLRHDAARLAKIGETLSRAAGGLDVAAVRLDEGTLGVSVVGPAVAARLRQREPGIVAALRQAGWAVDRLRIRIRVPDTPPVIPPLPRAPVPARAADALRSLAERTDDPRLRAGLEALAARRAGRR